MRPHVTLSYAQSLDGCIAGRPGQRLMLSGPESMRMTHQLRARHDGILVGIGTVLADNPRLNVRLVNGPNPQPIVLDSQLRCPLDCHLIRAAARPVWLFAAPDAPQARELALTQAGARVWRVGRQGHRLDLEAVLSLLHAQTINTIMVEGGGHVITAFLRAQLVDRLVLTIAPCLVGGTSAIAAQSFISPTLKNIKQTQLGADNIIDADLSWEREVN